MRAKFSLFLWKEAAMTSRAIIREGDPTSHGGTVLEGFPTLGVYGKRVAGIGHRGYCPQCKRDFVIVEGAPNRLHMGRSVAVEGMRTSCGAVLIATQHQAKIEIRTDHSHGQGAPGAMAAHRTSSMADTQGSDHLECYFVALREDGTSADLVYRIDADGEKLHEGRLNTSGATATFPIHKAGDATFWIPSA